jgi:hypothetical protein
MRKAMVSTVALGSLAWIALLYATAPAAAARQTCLQKAQACERRCAAHLRPLRTMNGGLVPPCAGGRAQSRPPHDFQRRAHAGLAPGTVTATMAASRRG